jgi:hypothetical protein
MKLQNDGYWDIVDEFLYYDHWHRIGHSKSISSRAENFNEIIQLFRLKKINLLLDKGTLYPLLFLKKIDESCKAEYLVTSKKNLINVKKLITKNKYRIVKNSRNRVYLLIQNRLIIIRFQSNFLNLFKKKSIKAFNENIDYLVTHEILYKLTYPLSIFSKGLFKKIQLRINTVIKRIRLFTLKRNLGEKFIDTQKQYTLNKKTFLNLNIESRKSPSWIVRGKHLNLVTDNGKNIKINDIVKHFAESKNFSSAMSQVKETTLNEVIDESISHSKYFWHNGNNYFIYSMYYQFKHDVLPYKDANDYLKNKSNINLYSKDYFESLENMSDFEIETFLRAHPIEITDNCITSGKHRVFAMIGRLISDKKYIPFIAEIY